MLRDMLRWLLGQETRRAAKARRLAELRDEMEREKLRLFRVLRTP